MTLKEARIKQTELHLTGERILSTKKILEELEKYGEVAFVGSFAAELMVKPDIDFEIVNPKIDQNKVIELTNFFFRMKGNYSVEIADGTDYVRRSGHPKGFYIGVNTMFENTIWRFDIWLTHKPIDMTDSMYVAMRDQQWYKKVPLETLNTILLLKHGLNEKGEYSKYASANVYEAVLEGEVKSLKDFYIWAKDFDTEALFRRGNSKST